MSLLSTDITKVKRLSLREVKLPTPERRVEPITPLPVEQPITPLEIATAKNPLLAKLVKTLELVPMDEAAQIQIEREAPKLTTLAKRILEDQNQYTKAEVIERIVAELNVTPDRAEEGFRQMFIAGAINPTGGGTYYLTDSTPF